MSTPRFARTNSPPTPTETAAAIENGSGDELSVSQFIVAGTIMAKPTTQIRRPTKNSTGRRSSMRTHQQTGWLLAAGARGAGTGERRRAGMRPRRCGVNGARYRSATSHGEPVEPSVRGGLALRPSSRAPLPRSMNVARAVRPSPRPLLLFAAREHGAARAAAGALPARPGAGGRDHGSGEPVLRAGVQPKRGARRRPAGDRLPAADLRAPISTATAGRRRRPCCRSWSRARRATATCCGC